MAVTITPFRPHVEQEALMIAIARYTKRPLGLVVGLDGDTIEDGYAPILPVVIIDKVTGAHLHLSGNADALNEQVRKDYKFSGIGILCEGKIELIEQTEDEIRFAFETEGVDEERIQRAMRELNSNPALADLKARMEALARG